MRYLAVLLLIWNLAANAQKLPHNLAEATLEELLNIEVTSVSKKEQKLVAAAAAIYVITQENIRRSGMTTIPEILRMAPGLDVAKIDGNRWAISSRGFNAQFSNKMLVLVDGRSVYLASDSGVYWNEQETMIEDIERIEVIRGPGATLWGANAVNGVINIITKSSLDTQGGLVTAGSGNDDHSVNGVRYGGLIGKRGAYRIYSKYSRRADLRGALDDRRDADWGMAYGGFRTDWKLSDRDSLMVQGSLSHDSAGVGLNIPILTAPFQRIFEDTQNLRAKMSSRAGAIVAPIDPSLVCWAILIMGWRNPRYYARIVAARMWISSTPGRLRSGTILCGA